MPLISGARSYGALGISNQNLHKRTQFRKPRHNAADDTQAVDMKFRRVKQERFLRKFVVRRALAGHSRERITAYAIIANRLKNMLSPVEIADEFLAQSQAFAQRAKELGLPDVSRYYWYHTIDLGDGLVTPGLYDYRETLDAFRFPGDMRGMTVLDVGSATGFFAFEFERRGARVISLELPSLEQLDRFPGQKVEKSMEKIERMIFPETSERLSGLARRDTARDLYWYLLEGPFRLCHERLKSRVERCYSAIYDLSPEVVGVRDGFDLIFIGDVLVHTLYPLKALAALAPLCKGTLVLSQMMPEACGNTPAMVYVGGDDPEEDHISWWLPNQECVVQMLKKLRFRTVEEAGRHTGILRPAGHPFERVVLHAVK